jgi:hypothetical protein
MDEARAVVFSLHPHHASPLACCMTGGVLEIAWAGIGIGIGVCARVRVSRMHFVCMHTRIMNSNSKIKR